MSHFSPTAADMMMHQIDTKEKKMSKIIDEILEAHIESPRYHEYIISLSKIRKALETDTVTELDEERLRVIIHEITITEIGTKLRSIEDRLQRLENRSSEA